MSQKTFRLPDLGEGLTESEIVTWRVAEGDAVTVNQVLADVETAKAVVEVSSPFAGVVAALHGAEGETLEVGAPLVTFTLEGAEPDVGGPAEGDGRVPTLVGYGAAPDTGKPGRRARRGSAAPATSAAPGSPANPRTSIRMSFPPVSRVVSAGLGDEGGRPRPHHRPSGPVDDLEAQLLDRNVQIELMPEAAEWLGEKGYDEKMGARPLGRVIQETIKKPLADDILFGRLTGGGHVKVQLKDGKIDFDITGASGAPAKEEEEETA